MDQNKCVALLTAIDLGNLTRAAEQLGYTQSGLSYVIKTLETELGFPLLVRSRYRRPSHRGLPADSPSAAGPGPKEPPAGAGGRRYPRPGRGHRLPGHLSLHLPFLAAGNPPDFAQHYPGITVSIRESGQEELDEWLREGSVDLAFCSYHENSQNHWIPSWRMKSGRWSPTGTLWRAVRSSPWPSWPANPSSWKTGPMTTTSPGVIQEAGVHPNVRWTSKDELAILAMVRLELGVSVMPALYLHEDHPGVTVRPLVPRAHRQLGASLPDLDSLSPAARRFLVRAKKTMGVTR